MISFLAIGDPHISDRHMPMTLEALENTYQLVLKRKDVGFIVVMGDVFDTHRNVKLEHMKIAFDWLKKIAAIKRTYVLVGNHDRVNNKDFLSDVHPYMGLKGVENLVIISQPSIIRVNSKYNIAFVPYVAPGRFKEAINLYIEAKHKRNELSHIRSIKDIHLIFAHQEFFGAPHGPITSIAGDKWELDYPMVVSGHIHTRMRLQENIFYTGSLYPIKISESNDKGVILGNFDPERKTLDVSVVRVVTSTKEIRRFDATDSDQVSEMVCLDRENTKYVVKGTPEEVAVVKNKCKGKNINVMFDIRPRMTRTTESLTFNEILRGLLQDESLRVMLEEVV
jgi:DNA repair exonuclease SbcCD nuclease subunit